jgi:hypothetical protein
MEVAVSDTVVMGTREHLSDLYKVVEGEHYGKLPQRWHDLPQTDAPNVFHEPILNIEQWNHLVAIHSDKAVSFHVGSHERLSALLMAGSIVLEVVTHDSDSYRRCLSIPCFSLKDDSHFTSTNFFQQCILIAKRKLEPIT